MFRYDDAVVSEFPTIRAGLVQARGLDNGPGSPELVDPYRAEQRSASDWLATTAIAELPSIAAWRGVGFSPGSAPSRRSTGVQPRVRFPAHSTPVRDRSSRRADHDRSAHLGGPDGHRRPFDARTFSPAAQLAPHQVRRPPM
jgi:hypothetical protein